MALALSGLVHLGLGAGAVYLCTRPVPPSPSIHVVELAPPAPEEPMILAVQPPRPRPGRIGGPRPETATVATLAAAKQPRRQPSKRVAWQRPQRPSPDDDEPTPFMGSGAGGSASRDLPRATAGQGRVGPDAPVAEKMSRIPLEAVLPDRPPSREVDPAEISRRGSQTGGDSKRFLWLSRPDRRHVSYFQNIYNKVQPLWGFPKDLEVLLEQGDVLVQFTVLSDGEVRNVRVRKSSGYRAFDSNVVAAIRKAAPFGPIPRGLGQRLHILAPFEFANPMVR